MAISVNISEFIGDISSFEELDVPALSVDEQRKIAVLGLSGLIFRTPVDTGRARGNWQLSLGYKISDAIETDDRAGVATFRKGAREVTKSQPYTAINIQNNVQYIEALEDGHSAQAPGGMLSLTFNDLKAQFKARG